MHCPTHDFTFNEGTRCPFCYPKAKTETASTGGIRSVLYTGGKDFPNRIDLLFLNSIALRRLGETYGEGNEKYGPTNWMKGFPESVYLNHALEHIRKFMSGDRTEDHLAHAAWNLLSLMWVEEEMPQLMDLTEELLKLNRIQQDKTSQIVNR